MCCIFHNICIINDDIIDQYIIDGREENPVDPELHLGDYDDEGGLEKQMRIVNMF